MVERGELVERLEKATGGDRELDEAIRAWEVGATIEWQEYKKANAYHRDGSWVSIEPITPVTASLDAAIALVDRTCPPAAAADHAKSEIILQICDDYTKATIHRDTFDYTKSSYGHGATPAIALLIALLKAGETG